jgi:DNA-binding GntR family transcriptional regulator
MGKRKTGAAVKNRSSSEGHQMAKKRKDELPVDVAFRKIKEMMYHHEIVPGQKLLYHELAKKLNMSVTPIIQALNRLQLLNIVYSERNKGYYVGEVDPVEAEELFTAREAFEIFLVPTIIKKITHKKLRTLEKALNEHVKAASVPEYRRILMIKDTNFHLQMIKLAENKVIYNICKLIFEQIYLKYRPEYMREERIKESAEEHRALLQALRERDMKKTRRLVRQHIKNGKEHVVASLWKERNFEI